MSQRKEKYARDMDRRMGRIESAVDADRTVRACEAETARLEKKWSERKARRRQRKLERMMRDLRHAALTALIVALLALSVAVVGLVRGPGRAERDPVAAATAAVPQGEVLALELPWEAGDESIL